MTRTRSFDPATMTAIDTHVHLEPSTSTSAFASAAATYFGPSRSEGGPEALAAYYRSRRIGCVVFSVDEELTGIARPNNEEVARFAADNSDIAIAFASINPHRGEDGVREARALVSASMVRGLKLHPPLQQFYPNDRMAYPLYEVFAEAGLPVIFHTGHSAIGGGLPGGGGVRLKFGSPLPIDDVAVDFPTLPIVMAHPSFPWQDEALSICMHKPTVYIDLSGWSPKLFPETLVKQINTRLKHKMLFGSDYPWLTPDRWLSDLDQTAVRDDVKPLLLKANAVRLLGLDT